MSGDLWVLRAGKASATRAFDFALTAISGLLAVSSMSNQSRLLLNLEVESRRSDRGRLQGRPRYSKQLSTEKSMNGRDCMRLDNATPQVFALSCCKSLKMLGLDIPQLTSTWGALFFF